MMSRALRSGLVAAIAAVAVFPVTAVASAAPATHVPGRGTPPSVVASSNRHPSVPQSSIPGLPGPRHHLTRHVLGRVTTHHMRLHVRSGPGTGYRVIGSRPAGRVLAITCKRQGSSVLGNRLWYRLAHGKGYVSAHYVRNLRAVRWC